jgi:cytochrome P450
MFFLATGGELRKHEREAFIDCVKNPLIFFPNWFNFLLAGHYLERKTLNSYYTLLEAFARYSDRSALCAAFKAAGTQKSQLEVLRLVAIVFSIAGSAAPAKLAFTVIEKLWSDKEKNVHLFKKNPQNFIKECARLDKVVPTVNVLATNEIANEIEEDFRNNNHPITIPENTPIHCSLVNANRDKKIFQNPDEFRPERSDLNKIIVWNGVEEDIMNKDKTKRPIRYCPGHDLSLEVIQYVAEQFSPVIFEDTENSDPKKIIGEELGKVLYP